MNGCIVKGMDEQLESLVLKKNAIRYILMYNIDDVGDHDGVEGTFTA